ncbi:hypothetical protein D3C72_2036030 [compost metagenome]
MIKQDNRCATGFYRVCNFFGLSFTDKVFGMRGFAATSHHLQSFDTRRGHQGFELTEIFCVFVLREIDMNQDGLLTGFITVKQACNLSNGNP